MRYSRVRTIRHPRQPSFGSSIRRRHPLAAGLTGCWLFNEPGGHTLINLALMQRSDTWSGATRGTGRRGWATTLSAASANYIGLGLDTTLFPVANQYTVMAMLRRVDSTYRQSSLFGPVIQPDAPNFGKRLWAALNYDDGFNAWGAFFNPGGGGTSYELISYPSTLSPGDDTWCWTVGPRGTEMWRDGVLMASSATQPSRDAATASFRLGACFTSTVSADGVSYHAFFIWKRQLATAEIRRITSDPFQIIEPARRRLAAKRDALTQTIWRLYDGAQAGTVWSLST